VQADWGGEFRNTDLENQMEAATNLRVSQVQADWGGELQNTDLEKELKQRGIISKETVPRHSETNAAIEGANRTIVTMSRTALIGAGLPRGLWNRVSTGYQVGIFGQKKGRQQC